MLVARRLRPARDPLPSFNARTVASSMSRNMVRPTSVSSPTLRLTQELAGAADFQILCGQQEARAQFLQRLDGFQAPFRILRQGLREGTIRCAKARWCERPTRPRNWCSCACPRRSAWLIMMVLAVGTSMPAFDDGRAQQHIEAAVVEIHHELFQVALAHLSMADADAGLRYDAREFRSVLSMVWDLVVHEVDLAAAAQFTHDGFANRGDIPVSHRGADGDAPRRRLS